MRIARFATPPWAMLVAVALSLGPAPAVAQHLIGATFASGQVQLVEVAIGTGVISLIGAGPTTAVSLLGIGSAYDETGNRCFFFGEVTADPTDRLFVVNAGDGTFVQGAVTGSGFDSILDIEYDDAEDLLYALVRVNTNDLQLATINTSPTPGAVTLLGSSFLSGADLAYAASELDETANRLYLTDNSSFRGVNTAINDIPAAEQGSYPAAIPSFQPDRSGGVVYALQFNTNLRVIELSTSAGTYGNAQNVGSDFAGASIATAGIDAFDPVNNIYYFIGTPGVGSPSLYAVDVVAAGKPLVAGFPHALSGATTNPLNLEFDSAGNLPVELQGVTVD